MHHLPLSFSVSTVRLSSLSGSINALITVRHIQEQVFLMVFLIHRRQGGTGWREGIFDEKEERFFWPHRHSLSDQETELTDCEV